MLKVNLTVVSKLKRKDLDAYYPSTDKTINGEKGTRRAVRRMVLTLRILDALDPHIVQLLGWAQKTPRGPGRGGLEKTLNSVCACV